MDRFTSTAVKMVTEDEQRARRMEILKSRFSETILRAGEKKTLCDVEHQNRMMGVKTEMRMREEHPKMVQSKNERKAARIHLGKIKKKVLKNDSNEPPHEIKNVDNTLTHNLTGKRYLETLDSQEDKENVPQAEALKTPDKVKQEEINIQQKQKQREAARTKREKIKKTELKNFNHQPLREIKISGNTFTQNISRKRDLGTLYVQDNKENVSQAKAIKRTDNDKQEQIKSQHRQKEREAAKLRLEKMQRTVFFNDSHELIQDVKDMGFTIAPCDEFIGRSDPDIPDAHDFENWVQQMQEAEDIKIQEMPKEIEVEKNDFLEVLRNLENMGYAVTSSAHSSPKKEVFENLFDY